MNEWVLVKPLIRDHCMLDQVSFIEEQLLYHASVCEIVEPPIDDLGPECSYFLESLGYC